MSRPRAIILVDHGSRRPAANQLIESVADDVRQLLPGEFVQIAHMELEPPTLGDAIEACVIQGATEIVVHPFLLGAGLHSQTTIPELVEAAIAKHPGIRTRVTGPLGPHEKLAEIVLARINETKF